MAPAIGSGLSHPLRPRPSCSSPSYIRPVLCVSPPNPVLCLLSPTQHHQQELAALTSRLCAPVKKSAGKRLHKVPPEIFHGPAGPGEGD